MSTRYNTGNPIESTDVRDMSDNAKNFDEFSLSTQPTFNDRLRVPRKTLPSLISQAEQDIYYAVINAGFQPVSFDFVTGGTLVSGDRNKAVFNPAPSGDNNWYAWQGAFPKIISPNSTPSTSGGLGENAWEPVTNNILAPTVRESIRRSYSEAGLKMVTGSFQAGFTLVNANDVAFDEVTGKAYSGDSGTYPPGTSTSSFTDMSSSLLRDRLYLLEDFWVSPDLDWTNAFERASLASKEGGFIVQCPPKELLVSDSVTLYTDTSSSGGEFYKAKGSRFVGHPRGTTVRKTATGTKPINATVYLQGGRGLQWSGIDIIDESPDSYGVYGSVDVSFSQFNDLFISTKNWGMYFNSPVYVGVEIENIVFAASATRAMQHSLRIPGGTTYKVKNISSFGMTGDAYFLSGSYVEIGPLACDDCAGVPYTFSQLDGSISALGVENIRVPSSGTVIKVTESSSINVDVMFLFSVAQPANTSLIDYNGFGRIKIGSIRGDGATTLSGRLTAVAGGGSVEVSYINKTPAQDSIGLFNLGNLAGPQYIQRYGSSEYKYLRMPEAPQNDETVRYRIMGRLYDTGCIGSITEARGGSGSFPRSAKYDINCIGSGSTQHARRVKRAVSDPSSNNYNAWFTAVYMGGTYVLCQLDTDGTRTLGSYFEGIINGTDRNLFKVVTASEVTSLAPLAGGVIKVESAS